MIRKILLPFWLAYWLVLASLAACSAQAQVKGLPDFTTLVEQQGPAVVNISSTQHVHSQQLPINPHDPAFELFHHFFPQLPGIPQRELENKTLGSGFIISADGDILTNAHVVAGADEVMVKLTDKREFKAKVLGADKRTDIALIKIKATGLPVVKVGDPSKLKVGEWVVAIGSPFGFDNSVTAGIVSAKGRSLPQENFVPFIQTDAAINPGNSGGPLFNMKGEVVGVNSQIYSRTGGYMGLAFAIPIDVAMQVQRQLKTSGYVSRGRIGVIVQEITRALADSFGLAEPTGALVTSVEKGGPADKAGVEPGDVILKFDGKTVDHSADLPRIVGASKPGARVTMQIWRKNAGRQLSVHVGAIPEDKPAQPGGQAAKPAAKASANRLGLALSELSAAQKRELNLRHGLVVEAIRAGVSDSDLRAGDVILAMISKGAQIEATSVEQFNKLLTHMGRSATVTLLVRRGENQSFITLRTLGEQK